MTRALHVPELDRTLVGRQVAIWEGTEDDGSPLKMSAADRAWHLRRMRGELPTPPPSPPPAPVAPGVGTELKELLASLGVTDTAGCSCTSRAAEMDRHGPAWCRANRGTIAGWLRDEAKARSWAERIAAGVRAVAAGVANPLDPYGSIVDEAVRRYDAKNPPPVEPRPKVVLPRDRRPVWMGGVLQIWVTRACDRSCYHCTQGSNFAGDPGSITVDQFAAACESLRDYFGVVGVFGGNPTLHPQFADLCRVMRETIPWERRGLWSNHPRGHGTVCAVTFNPAHSNLNVHQSKDAWDEFARDWSECRPYLKGLDADSRHAPPFVAMKDVIADEAERVRLIESCDVNQRWSALIGVFRGQLRAWFCELAGAQAMLHQHDLDYPDTGVPVTPGWWKSDRAAFAHQIDKHCHECGIPLRGHGALANTGPAEQVSATHAAVCRPKRPGRPVEPVVELVQLGTPLTRATDYLENGRVT